MTAWDVYWVCWLAVVVALMCGIARRLVDRWTAEVVREMKQPPSQEC